MTELFPPDPLNPLYSTPHREEDLILNAKHTEVLERMKTVLWIKETLPHFERVMKTF